MDSTGVQVCRCVRNEHETSDRRRKQCMGPSSNCKISSSSIVKKNLRDSSLRAKGEARARGGRKRRTSHLPLLPPPHFHQHGHKTGWRQTAPTRKENGGSGSSSSSSGISRASSVNSSGGGPRRIRKRVRPPARGNDQRSSPCCSPNGTVEGTAGGGAQHGCKSSRNPLDNSPYANRVTFGNNGGCRNISTESTNPDHPRLRQAPPLPVLTITARGLEERETKRTSEVENNCSRATDKERGESKCHFGEVLSLSFDGGGDGVGVASTAAPDSPRSVNSTNSFETLASTGDLFGDYDGTIVSASAASAAVAKGGDTGRAVSGLGVIERTLFESWKELPWQARVCPKAIENQEVVRRTAALEAESLRVQSWRQQQQALATSAARDEERAISSWWRQEAERLWAFQSQRRRDHVELGTHQEAELAARESQGADLLSVGYGKELAQLDRMDLSDHHERLKRVEALFAIAIREHDPKEAQDATTPEGGDSSGDSEGGEDKGAVNASVILPTCAVTVVATRALPKDQREATADAKLDQQQPGGVVQVIQETDREDGRSLDSGRIERMCVQAQSELEQVARHASAVAAAADRFCRRRQSLAYLLYRGLAAVYRDVRGAAWRMFVSECAADIGRIKQLASFSSSSGGGGEGGEGGGGGGGSGNGTINPSFDRRADGLCSGIVNNGHHDRDPVGLPPDSKRENKHPTTETFTPVTVEAAAAAGPEAARSRETRRVTQELENEADRVAFWDKIQREVLRRSTSEVTKLLAADSLRRAPVEGGRTRASGGAESIQALRKRARASMRELRGRQAAACLEARSIERSWMSALARWAGQLEKARAAAIGGEIGELRILQQEDAEALAAQENAAVLSLARRRETLLQSWENVFEAERARIADTAGAWRHCLLGACTKLRALVEESQRERSRTVESWNDEHARAMERSRVLADVIAREQRVIADEHSVLLVELARNVADNTEKEAEAAAVARRNWWAEARESLVSLFILAHDSHQACQGLRLSPRSENVRKVVAGVDVVGDPASETTRVSVASSLPLIRTRLDDLLRAEETRAAKAKRDIIAAADTVEAGRGGEVEVGQQGPLHLAVAEKQRLSGEAIRRCLDAVETARPNPLPEGGKGDQGSAETNPAAEYGVTAPSSEGSGSGKGGRRRRGTRNNSEQEMGQFLSRLEAGVVQLAAASFETEVRLLAIGPASPPTAAEVTVSLPPPPETILEEKTLSLPVLSEDGPPADLTRSQLDLRRTARVKAFARVLGDMLCRGREALQKQALQLRNANEKEYTHTVSVAVSLHSQRVGELQTRARAQAEEALKDALTQVETRSEECSSRLKSVATIRRRVVESAIGWVHVTLEANLRRLERRRRRQREQEQHRAETLENFGRAALGEQREWLLRITDQRREATEVARTVIADHIAEIVDQHKRQTAAAATAAAATAAAASAGVMVTAEGTALDGGYAEGQTKQLTTGDSDDHRSGDDDDDDDRDDDDDAAVAAPALHDRLQAEVAAVLDAVESSCLSGVDSWAEETRRRAQELDSSWDAEAALHDCEERGTVETELATLELAFRAARKDAEEAVTDCRALLLAPNGEDGDASSEVTGAAVGGTTISAGSTNLAPEEGAAENEPPRNQAEEPMPDFFAKEQEECRAFWSSFEPPLASLRLKLGTTESVGTSGMSKQRGGHGDQEENGGEEGKEEGVGAGRESAVRVFANLESVLRDELTETFSKTKTSEEVQGMIGEGNEELRLAFVLVGDERRTKRKEEKRRNTLALLLAAEEEEAKWAKVIARESARADTLDVPAGGG